MRMRWLHGITNSMEMNLSKHWEIVKDREAWLAVVHVVTKSRPGLSYSTTAATTNSLSNRTEDLKINDHFQYCLFYL